MSEWDIKGHVERVAWRKAGRIEGWEVYKRERLGIRNDVLMTGGVPRLLKKGKNKALK